MTEVTIWVQKSVTRGPCVSSDLGTLTSKASPCPSADICVHSGPDVALTDEPLSGPNSGMTTIMAGMENGLLERWRHRLLARACGSITDQRS